MMRQREIEREREREHAVSEATSRYATVTNVSDSVFRHH